MVKMVKYNEAKWRSKWPPNTNFSILFVKNIKNVLIKCKIISVYCLINSIDYDLIYKRQIRRPVWPPFLYNE